MKKILIIGAGEGGKRLIGEILRDHKNYQVAGFLDDKESLQNQLINGYKVLGKIRDLRKIAIKFVIDEILIAIPSLRGSKLAQIIKLIGKTKLPYRILPGVFESIDYYEKKRVDIGKLRDVEPSDLLDREPIEMNTKEISEYLQNKTVFITGAGGSIGSEITRQIIDFDVNKLILMDIYENNLYELGREFDNSSIEVIIGDIKDKSCLKKIFNKFKIDIIFHAAAHKHVPLMEKEPQEAVKNNILGTNNLIKQAIEHKIEKFIFISTDKTLYPTSIMGATKRFSEKQMLNQSSKDTIFVIVRFGNVLGSYGSIIPLWKKQLSRNEPLTVTHPKMKRFFMTIPEAVQLVIQAGALAMETSIFVLKMGKQYYIYKLAEDLIKLAGLVPGKDAQIVITGPRPGEKLSETLFEDGDKVQNSPHKMIAQIRPKADSSESLNKTLKKFEDDIDNLEKKDIVALLRQEIPTFIPYQEISKPDKIEEIINFSPPEIGNEEIEAVRKVLKSGWLTMGPEVLKFEEFFKNFYNVDNAIAVSSATAGLHLALVSFDIGAGDEVILPSYTFTSCANVITHVGARPVFVDITKEGSLIDPKEIEQKITPKTKAIMVVHFAGQMAEMDEIVKIAKSHHVKIIEDCAHSLGAKYYGKLAGTIGDIGVFSFYATKNLTTGEGGMVIAKDAKIISRIRSLRLHGMNSQAYDRYAAKGKWYYEIEEPGFKYNMTDLSAAIGNEQLKKISSFNKQRNIIAKYYLDNLRNDKIILPQVLPHREHVWHLFPILVPENLRDGLIEFLRSFNIITSVHFIPLHFQPFYKKKYGYKTGDLPVSEKTFASEISLPIYPSLDKIKIEYICRVIKYFFEERI